MQRIVAAVLFLCAGLFASESVFGSLATTKGSAPMTRSNVSMTPAAAEEAVDSAYVLGPGDFLDVMLEQNYLTIQVAPDGTVAIEECGIVNVGGKTLSEAREMILELAAKRFKREFCFVQLAALKKFKVNAMGAIGQVGQHMVDPQTRLSYFIRQAGGTVSRANNEDIWVLRGKDTIHVNYTAMSSNGNFEDDIMLQQGDRIYVPYVGLVASVSLIFPGFRTSVAYKENRTLQEYFELAGGDRLHSFGYKAVCVREPDKTPRWIAIGDMKTTTVAPNTEVEFTVQEMLVYVGGAVNFLGRYPYDPSWHALDYVAAAGMNTISGSWNQVKVWRGEGPEPISVNVVSDPIMPGDYIEIPKSHYESFKDFTLFLASLLTVISSAFIIYVNYK